MCQTPIITAQIIPKGCLYWQSADVHCFVELKTSNQILCCTNVIATTAILGVMDNANSLSYETTLNTQFLKYLAEIVLRFPTLALRTELAQVNWYKVVMFVVKENGRFNTNGRVLQQNRGDCWQGCVAKQIANPCLIVHLVYCLQGTCIVTKFL